MVCPLRTQTVGGKVFASRPSLGVAPKTQSSFYSYYYFMRFSTDVGLIIPHRILEADYTEFFKKKKNRYDHKQSLKSNQSSVYSILNQLIPE